MPELNLLNGNARLLYFIFLMIGSGKNFITPFKFFKQTKQPIQKKHISNTQLQAIEK